MISVISVIFLFIMLAYNFIHFIWHEIIEISAIGFHNTFFGSGLNIDLFFFNTKTIVFISIILYTSVMLSLLLGRRMIEGRIRVSFDMFYFIIIYSVIAPFWILKALLNATRSKQSSWILEREVKKAKQKNATTI